MKKKLVILLTLLAVIGLCGCGGTSGDTMYIEPAQLTEEEEKIVDLLDRDIRHCMFDFSVDDTLQSAQFQVYQLVEGAWSPASGGGSLAFSDAEGRLILDFDDLRTGLRVAVQSKRTGDSSAYEKDTGEEPETSGLGRGTSVLRKRTEIAYEAEIPLAMQVFTPEDTIILYDPAEVLDHPEEYTRYGYEAYVITVSFSRDPLS
nr:hypothetical protein [uncultured Oscillibacter sp.]